MAFLARAVMEQAVVVAGVGAAAVDEDVLAREVARESVWRSPGRSRQASERQQPHGEQTTLPTTIGFWTIRVLVLLLIIMIVPLTLTRLQLDYSRAPLLRKSSQHVKTAQCQDVLAHCVLRLLMALSIRHGRK